MKNSEAIRILSDVTLCSPLGQAAFVGVEAIKKLQKYQEIGTVEECREARERNMAKKYKEIHPCKSVTYYQCPCCDGLLHINENFCGECGQAIDWSDTD